MARAAGGGEGDAAARMTCAFALDARLARLAEERRCVGGKAANIATMALELGLPVPPGFDDHDRGVPRVPRHGWPDGLDDELRAQVARLEAAVGRRFGDPADPLLVSVRSGAPVSMPGMMDTILNLGLNDATRRAWRAASGDPAFARDCHERFEAELPLDRRRRRRPGGPVASSCGGAIEAVFRSWTSDRRGPTGGWRASPTTSGPASRSRRWCSATSARLGTGVAVHAQPGDRRGRAVRRRAVRRAGRGRRRGHARDRADRGPRRAAAGRRRGAARDADAPRAPLPRLLRHRVHDRARPAVAAPGAGRQADAAGRAADGRGHGRGPGVPADRGEAVARVRRSSRTRRRRRALGRGGAARHAGWASPGLVCGES